MQSKSSLKAKQKISCMIGPLCLKSIVTRSLILKRVKIDIWGLHYHPSDLFLFHGFFHHIPLLKVSILVHVLFINPVMDLFYCYRTFSLYGKVQRKQLI